MRGLKPLAVLAAALLLCGPALAADTAAAAKARADGIIAEAAAADVFENAAQGGQARARHKASGMLCRFDDARVDGVKIIDGAPRGEAVACRTSDGVSIFTFSALYGLKDANENLDGTIGGLKRKFSNVEEIDPPANPGAKIPNGQSATRFFRVNDGTQDLLVRVSAVWVRGWAIQLLSISKAGDIDELRRATDPRWAEQLTALGLTA